MKTFFKYLGIGLLILIVVVLVKTFTFKSKQMSESQAQLLSLDDSCVVRLQKAKALLANPSLSIGAIALDCGYIDAGYFARVFKQEYGVTPQEWRVGR